MMDNIINLSNGNKTSPEVNTLYVPLSQSESIQTIIKDIYPFVDPYIENIKGELYLAFTSMANDIYEEFVNIASKE